MSRGNSLSDELETSFSAWWCRMARCMERDARFAAGLESSFSSFGETSLVVLTHRCQMLNGGEAAEGA